jgi:small neutral amino acid transporter SnatA (MarC family)
MMMTDLTVRGKEALRAMSLRFAQAPFAETKQGRTSSESGAIIPLAIPS